MPKLQRPSKPISAPKPRQPKAATTHRIPIVPVARKLPPEPPKRSRKEATVVFPRTTAEAKIWEQIKKRVLPLTSDGRTTGQLASNVQQIEAGFVFVQQPQDSDFSPLHIEPLIDQASDLMDRGIRDRFTYDDLAAKNVLLTLELMQFAELDRIHQDEEAAGYYDVDSQQSRSAYLGEYYGGYRARSDHAYLLQGQLDDYYNPQQVGEQLEASSRLAWTTGLLSYYFADADSFDKNSNYTGNSQEVNLQWINPNWPGAATIVPQLAVDATWTLSTWRLFSERDSLFAQWFNENALASASIDQRIPGLQAKYFWDSQNSTFMLRRTLVARGLEDIKAKAATDYDGLLNYGKRLTSLRERFAFDFRAALARLVVLRDGLPVVYGYDVPLPQPALGSIGYFDDCLLWAREAVQWLIRFSRQDQSLVRPISVRSAVGEAAWEAGRSGQYWSFDVPEAVFDGLAHVRLRGLSAVVRPSDKSDDTTLWQMTIVPPLEGTILHLSGQTVTVDQTRVPPCRLGRVAVRNAAREPDLTGVSSLFNASPIGQWSVAVIGSVPGEREFDDIVIDLTVVFRVARPRSTFE